MRWIVITAILLILGVFLQMGYLVFALYVLLGLLSMSNALARHWANAIEASRNSLRMKIEIGDEQTVTLELRNSTRLGIPWVIFEETFPRASMERVPPRLSLKGHRKGLGITPLPAHATHHVAYTVTFKQRGYYQLGPLRVETGDLFGLQRSFRILTSPQFVLVLPRILPLQRYDIASNRPLGETRITHRLLEDPTRIAAIRPYQPGDPLNQIHWRATARTGALHSRVYENSCVAGATLLLDFHQEAYQGSGQEVSTELAVTATASIAHALFEEGHQVGLVSNGRDAAERITHEGWTGQFTRRTDAQRRATTTRSNDRLRPVTVPTRKGADQLTRILENLARLELNDGLSFSQLIEEGSHLLPRDATVIPILRNPTAEAALALGMLRRRGFEVTALLVQFGEGLQPDWAATPSWAKPLVSEGIRFLTIASESDLSDLSTHRFQG